MRPTSLHPILEGVEAPSAPNEHELGRKFAAHGDLMNLTVTPDSGSAPLAVQLGGTFTYVFAT